MSIPFIEDLKSALPEGSVLAAEEDIICYGSDATRMQGRPTAIVRPNDTGQIGEIVNIAAKHRTPLVPRGAGTGLSGGCVPVKGGIVLVTELLRGIREINPVDMLAVVEPGVVTANLQDRAEAEGLFYPPDPASHKSCTIGGNVAENAGGLRGLKYGVTRDYVMSLDVVLPSGKLIKTGGRTIKNVTGYDLTRLIVGSEGTLGVITGAVLKLIPKPETRACFLASFNTLDAASEAVVSIIKSGITPSTLELMDAVTIKAVTQYQNTDCPDFGALILVEVDGSAGEVRRQAALLQAVLTKSGAKELREATDPAEQAALWAARRAALSALARVSPSVILEDATVPRSKVPAMVRAIEGIAAKYGLTIGTFGHAGDGNLHPTILTDLRVKENADKAHAAAGEIFKAALGLGGTLSGEHGIGLTKSAYLASELGEAGVGAMRAVKDAFDPAGIMNPGKIFT